MPSRRGVACTVPAYDGLTAFAPCWGVAALFSIAGDPHGLLWRHGDAYFAIAWIIAALGFATILFPRKTWLLVALAGATLALYAIRLPVASNNKTITAVFSLAMLAAATVHQRRPFGPIDRTRLYDSLRLPARLLLATMYFYGVFHKINTDFFDPSVSCAVGLYQPLARPFGLEDSLLGRYAAIWSTFVIEGIAIVALFWKRYFAIGLLVALLFHYIIPISAYSWYMDFSSLVFALYMLSMPREASGKIYELAYSHLVHPLRQSIGRAGIMLPVGLVLSLAALVTIALDVVYPGRSGLLVLHSIFMLVWAVVGGVSMVVMAYAALLHLPYNGPRSARQPGWAYVIPGLFFVSCLSPYLGLKTESSINMFSNLHTEGGRTNHLLMPKVPYLFDYQREVVQVLDSSSPFLTRTAAAGNHHVLFSVEEYLRRNPQGWVTYRHGGEVVRATGESVPETSATWLERKLLIFKPVNFARPKVCTH